MAATLSVYFLWNIAEGNESLLSTQFWLISFLTLFLISIFCIAQRITESTLLAAKSSLQTAQGEENAEILSGRMVDKRKLIVRVLVIFL